MSSKDPRKAREEITRTDINRTLGRAGRKMTPTDEQHTRELKGEANKRAASQAKATKAAAAKKTGGKTS